MKNKKTMKTAAILLFSSTLAFTSLPTLSLAETDVATTQSDVKSSGDYAALLDAYTSAREKYLPIREAYEQALGDYLASGEEDADTVAQLKADYEKVVAEYEGVKEKYDQAKAAYDEATAVFQTASDAYEAAVTAKDTLNQSIEAVNTIIQAFPADPATATMTVAEWKSAFDEAKAALEGNYATHWPAIEAYQTASDAYYNSSIAPDSQAPIVIENESGYKKILEDFINSIGILASEDTKLAEANEELLVADRDFQQAYDEYKINAGPYNPGDPTDDFENIWKPIIHAHKSGDYTWMGYSNEKLKSMTTREEWDQFIADYERVSSDAQVNFQKYGDYLYSVADTWDAAFEKMKAAVAEFNQVTGNNVGIRNNYKLRGWTDGMILNTKYVSDGNIDALKKMAPLEEFEKTNAYDWLLNSSYNAVEYGGHFPVIGDFIDIVIPPYTPKVISVSIEKLSIKELTKPNIQDLEKLPSVPTEAPNDPQDPSEEPNDPQDPSEEPNDPQDPNEEPNDPQQPSDDQSNNKEKPKEDKTKKTTTFTQTLPKTGSENNILLSAAGFGAILLSGILVLLKKKR